ncbi:TetR/AcrR family transcriptional regulator [Rarobacter faecitabidus]|uniref:TetR family transcriptional regulator n=1 Tax=Rarobacter faecitabidus TaxID=13243 RepID=A0A542ZVI1_RARFA|nr:TetR-like C-terminal domain-containing protein [Rarobacter faecitabidus]TQL64365.1 TetR family transcriptional regulator [Rarobacter faecitabidus]
MPRMNLTEPAVIAAAAELADEAGFEALSVSAVARRLEVQPASLYSHVRDRSALLSGVQRLALGELGGRVSQAVAGRAGSAALRALADAHRDYAIQRPGAWSALQYPADEHTVASPEAARIATLSIAVMRGYRIPPDDAVHAVRLVAATINGFLALDRGQAFAHRNESAHQSWLAAIAALDRALSTWPQGSGK